MRTDEVFVVSFKKKKKSANYEQINRAVGRTWFKLSSVDFPFKKKNAIRCERETRPGRKFTQRK